MHTQIWLQQSNNPLQYRSSLTFPILDRHADLHVIHITKVSGHWFPYFSFVIYFFSGEAKVLWHECFLPYILNFPVKSYWLHGHWKMIISFSCSHSDCSRCSNEKSECCQLKFKPLEKVHCFKINNGFFRQNLCLHNLCISQRLQFELLDGTGRVNFSICEPPSILENL